MADPRTDEELLAAVDGEPEAFAAFYRRHVRGLLGYFSDGRATPSWPPTSRRRRSRPPSTACVASIPRRGSAVAWLYGIARRQHAHALRRGAVEDRARRRLGMAPIDLTDEALERMGALADDVATSALAALPPDQREAVEARIVDEREYADIALAARTSESVVRKRVSRGLAGLRSRLEENGT